MGDVIPLFGKEKNPNIDERPLTPELIKEYTEALVLAAAILDRLDKEQTDSCFWMAVNFNERLMKYIEENEI